MEKTAAAYQSVADAHNETAQQVIQVQQQLSGIQEAVSQEVQKLAETIDPRLEALRQELREALSSEVEKLAAALQLSEQRQETLQQALDVTHAPKLDTLQKSVEDLIAQQGEFTSKTLPSWRVDVGTEVHKVADDLGAKQRQMDKEISQHKAEIQKQADKSAKIQADLEKCLQTRLLELERSSAKLITELEMSTTQSVTRGEELEARLRKDFVGSPALEELGARISCLQSAFSQSDFERLAAAEQTKRTFLSEITKEMEAVFSQKAARLDELAMDAGQRGADAKAKQEAESVLDMIRADESVRLARLEDGALKADKRVDLIQKNISEELERSGKEAAATTETRIQDIRESLNALFAEMKQSQTLTARLVDVESNASRHSEDLVARLAVAETSAIAAEQQLGPLKVCVGELKEGFQLLYEPLQEIQQQMAADGTQMEQMLQQAADLSKQVEDLQYSQESHDGRLGQVEQKMFPQRGGRTPAPTTWTRKSPQRQVVSESSTAERPNEQQATPTLPNVASPQTGSQSPTKPPPRPNSARTGSTQRPQTQAARSPPGSISAGHSPDSLNMTTSPNSTQRKEALAGVVTHEGSH